MKTKAVRIYGVDDLRLEEFELPPIKDDEILARIVSDSICMSSHKLAMQGDRHKRVRAPLATSPVIIGHEFCGELVEVGRAMEEAASRPGQKFAIQPALNYKGSLWAPGYSYQYIGGDATYVVIPSEVMELGCLLEYKAEAFFMGSLSEPVSCIVGAYHAQYHTKGGSYVHEMGIREGGSLALLASVGPMGIGAIDYAMHAPRRPSRVVVTDIDEARLARAASIFTVEEAKRNGVDLRYVNTKDIADPVAHLKSLNGGGSSTTSSSSLPSGRSSRWGTGSSAPTAASISSPARLTPASRPSSTSTTCTTSPTTSSGLRAATPTTSRSPSR